ncbi:hypothetical protein [Halovivax cerinus]|uniref:Archaeal flagellin-like protein n=1 Tax=Halovivax cerinus TaxID=1487865 RepID=A0ABD5NTP7_9EURY|nr:hypothetical protein [Halovivax cerinus]
MNTRDVALVFAVVFGSIWLGLTGGSILGVFDSDEAADTGPNVTVWAEEHYRDSCRVLANVTVGSGEAVLSEQKAPSEPYPAEPAIPARLVREDTEQVSLGVVHGPENVSLRSINTAENRIGDPLIYSIDTECNATIVSDPFAEAAERGESGQ